MVVKLAKVITGAAAVGYFALGGFLAWLLNDNVNESVDGRMSAYVEEHPDTEVDPDKVVIVVRIFIKLYIIALMPAKLIWHGIKYSFVKWMERC